MSIISNKTEDPDLLIDRNENFEPPSIKSNLVAVQSLFRTYHIRALFSLIKENLPASHFEVFTTFSLFKNHFNSYIHKIILDHLETTGMRFKPEEIANKLWVGPITDDFYNFYYGEINELKIPHGVGVLVSFCCVYEGSWEFGKFHGKGRMIDTKNGAYDGDWSQGEKHGNGVMIYWGGKTYTGTWANNKRNGHGILEDYRIRFEGNFENDLKNGYGEELYPEKWL
ncbi:unnamed protein product [Blepharisma stoltei]|uniref:MORN repeat-containing protein 3 n=1 Tax=Blepharisma stoltei TaxID=1481888 RepID=A0AAU9JK35_9CILI|nr:unnamed protein product [Blepharisma stoltei]